jgi:hypothetical protein
MLRGSYHPGHNQPGRSFRGDRLFPGGRSRGYPQQSGGYNRLMLSAMRPTTGDFTMTCFACGKPGHKSCDCPDKKTAATPVRAPAPGGLMSPAQARIGL